MEPSKGALTSAEKMRVLRQRRREGVENVVPVPVTWPQINHLVRQGLLDREVLRDEVPVLERREAIGKAIAKLVAMATQTKEAA